jgi:hypothetical protein
MRDGILGRHTKDAADKKNGITLDEMEDFIKGARAKGIAGGTKIQMWSTWRQSAHRVRVEGHVVQDGEGDTDEKH